MKKNKEEKIYSRILIGLLIALILLVLALYFINEGKNKKNEEEVTNLSECIKKASITLYGKKDSNLLKEQLDEIKDIADSIEIIDCSEEREKCINILLFPTWKIKNNTYYSYFSRGILIKLAGCEQWDTQ